MTRVIGERTDCGTEEEERGPGSETSHPGLPVCLHIFKDSHAGFSLFALDAIYLFTRCQWTFRRQSSGKTADSWISPL